MKRTGNLMVDWFRGGAANSIRMQGLELVISLTATSDSKFLFRVYRCVVLKLEKQILCSHWIFRTSLKKEVGERNPRVELVEIGPSIDFVVARSRLASEDLYRTSLKKPKIPTVINYLNFHRHIQSKQIFRNSRWRRIYRRMCLEAK
jgi:ribosome production factor 2